MVLIPWNDSVNLFVNKPKPICVFLEIFLSLFPILDIDKLLEEKLIKLLLLVLGHEKTYSDKENKK